MSERPQWKDKTSYSRDDRERIPSIWQLQLTRDIRISVVRKHIHNPDSWVMHCAPWFDTQSLGLPPTVENRDEAMARAVTLVRAEIDELSTIMRGMN